MVVAGTKTWDGTSSYGPCVLDPGSRCAAGYYELNSACVEVDPHHISPTGDQHTNTVYGKLTVPNAEKNACISCASGFIAVPALSGYTTQSFCVAKYEMKRASDNLEHAESVPAG